MPMQMGQRRGSSWQLPSGSSFTVYSGWPVARQLGQGRGNSRSRGNFLLGLALFDSSKPHISKLQPNKAHVIAWGKAAAGPQGSCNLLASLLVSGMPMEATFSRVRICGFFGAAHFRTASRAGPACEGSRPQAHQAQKHHRPSNFRSRPAFDWSLASGQLQRTNSQVRKLLFSKCHRAQFSVASPLRAEANNWVRKRPRPRERQARGQGDGKNIAPH